jgi:cytochrome c551/c552
MMHDMMNMMGGMGWAMGLVWAAVGCRARPWSRRPRELRVFRMTSPMQPQGVPQQNRRPIMNHIQSIAMVILALVVLPYQAVAQPGDASRGERMYRACVACHSLEPNRNMTGPSLAEVWNRKAGALARFARYSPALKSAGIIWNDESPNGSRSRSTSFLEIR